MNQRASFGGWRALLAAAAVVVLVLGIRELAGVIAPLLLALVITVALTPGLRWLTHHRVPGWLAVVLILVVFIGVLALLSLMVAVSLAGLDERLPAYRERLDALLAGLASALVGIPGLPPISGDLDELVGQVDPSTAISGATGLARSLAAGLADGALIILVVIYMLFEALGFRRRLIASIGTDRAPFRRLSKLGRDIQRYVGLSAALGAAAAVLNTGLLLGLGVDFAILWGVLSFVLSFVPNIGFIVALVPPAMVALLQFGWERSLAVIVGYVVINTAIDNGFKPKIMGDGVNLSPLTILLFLVFGAWLLGPLGALLAVPLAIMVRLVLASLEETRWLAVLMSDRPDEALVEPTS